MGKQETTVYQCDNQTCGQKFFNEDDVFEISRIGNGDGEDLINDSMLCPQCLLQFLFVDRNIIQPIEDIYEIIEDEINKKNEEEDEEEYDFGDDD